jgi:hypothetical protein
MGAIVANLKMIFLIVLKGTNRWPQDYVPLVCLTMLFNCIYYIGSNVMMTLIN